MFIISGTNGGPPLWERECDGSPWTGIGTRGLLDLPLTAFFASRQCPGLAIRAAMDWALQQAQAGQVVASGFHSPLEQSVLKVLLTARSPVIAVLTRPLQGSKLPPAWQESMAKGRMAVISCTPDIKRLTIEGAELRNRHIARMASAIVVAHASPGGSLAGLITQWEAEGKVVTMLSHQ